MSIVQAPRPPGEPVAATPSIYQRWRFPLLCVLLLIATGMNAALALSAPPIDGPLTPFLWLWLSSFLPYLAASFLILSTKAPSGRRQWIELGVILGGALILRALLLPIPPNLSHDSWRYLWDARVTLHGYSPYAYAPGDPLFTSLRDFIFANSRFRNVPTIYPPAAQAVYLLSYILAPSNLFVLKGIFLVADLVTCAALALLLKRRGLDPARCLIYAWCPLPIIEFALQGHVDVLTLTFMVLTILCALSQRRGARVLTGFLLALATLTKIYPIVLLVVVLRRRDWALLATCFATIILAYTPYLLLGHGQIFGFFATYASEHTPNAGIVQLALDWLAARIGIPARATQILEYAVDLLVVGGVSLLILWLRLRERISMEAGTLILIGTIFTVSSHIFPWYTTALLPWIALLVRPIWIVPIRERGDEIRAVFWPRVVQAVHGRGLAVAMAWYFTCISTIAYFFNTLPDWNSYYFLVYDVTLAGLLVAAIAGIMHIRQRYAKPSQPA
ncbi:MAG: glycosyltransferase family 87 protein [Ktedonobacteraceae bacterium]